MQRLNDERRNAVCPPTVINPYVPNRGAEGLVSLVPCRAPCLRACVGPAWAATVEER
jgi:hypothetical protein